jgi:hypothetical protein
MATGNDVVKAGMYSVSTGKPIKRWIYVNMEGYRGYTKMAEYAKRKL